MIFIFCFLLALPILVVGLGNFSGVDGSPTRAPLFWWWGWVAAPCGAGNTLWCGQSGGGGAGGGAGGGGPAAGGRDGPG